MSERVARTRGRTGIGIAIGVALVAGALTLAPLCLGARTPSGPARLVILHTNDVHGWMHPESTPKGKRGGYPNLVHMLRRERDRLRAEGVAVLTLDGGDIYTGTPEGDMTQGALIVDLMNRVGFDAVEVGNHEFDRGVANVERLVARSRFPWLGANVIDETTQQRVPWLRPSMRLRIAGLDVCVIGVLTHGLKHMTTKKGSAGVDATPEAPVIERELLRNADAQVFILLSHVGDSGDYALARHFHGRLAAIIGGHSHTPIFEPRREAGTLVVQAGSYGKWLGETELELERPSGRVLSARGSLIEIDPATEPAAPDIARALADGSREVARIMDVKIGGLTARLDRDRRNRSSAIGNWITDIMREHTKADVAFHNKTGIRADMDKGDVRLRDLEQVSPFGNTVPVATLTGDQLRELFESSLSRGRAQLEVSGMTMKIDTSAPRGRRLLELTVGGAPVEPAKKYRVATNNFLAEGGDGITTFSKGADRQDDGTTLLEMTRVAMQGKTFAVPAVEPRIVDVSRRHGDGE